MKARRQNKILEIISHYPIETQQQLAEKLGSEGLEVTQATLSRDIKELALVKVKGENGKVYYAPPGGAIPVTDERLHMVLTRAVLSIDFSENLIVVKTYPGEAQGVAFALDNIKWKEIIGTVGGDDTVLVIVKPKDSVHLVVDRLSALSKR